MFDVGNLKNQFNSYVTNDELDDKVADIKKMMD
jgi:hypothetical protein